MLTSDFKKKEADKMNDSQSTLMGFNPSVRQQVDLFSNLIAAEQSSLKKGTKLSMATIDKMKDQDTLNNTRLSAMDHTARDKITSAMSKPEMMENKYIKNK